MNDPFAEYEAELYEQGQRELAKEKADWDALPQAEKDRINAEREARIDAMFDQAPEDEDEDEDEGEGEDEDEEDGEELE